MSFFVYLFFVSALARANMVWPEPRSASLYADELSEIQMRFHRQGVAEGLVNNRMRRIAWAAIRPNRPIEKRLIVDPGSKAPTSMFIKRLGIVNEENGERLLRIFFHPEDTLYRKRIVRDLNAQGDRIVHWGTTIGYASASRSIFVPVEDHVVMIKTSTNMVNGARQDKKFTFDDALRSVMNSAALRENMPGEVMEEPIAVEITPEYGYVVRHFAKFEPTGNPLWVPGYAFGINEGVDTNGFETWFGQDMRTPLLREWARLTTRANVFFEMANNHLQNVIVALDRQGPRQLKTMLLDTNDFDQSPADVERGRQLLELGPEAGAKIQTVRTLRINRFAGARTMNLSEVARLRDFHLAEDLIGLPTEHVDRLVSQLSPGRSSLVARCQDFLANVPDSPLAREAFETGLKLVIDMLHFEESANGRR